MKEGSGFYFGCWIKRAHRRHWCPQTSDLFWRINACDFSHSCEPKRELLGPMPLLWALWRFCRLRAAMPSGNWYLPPYVHMLVWSQQSTHSYEELAKCLACFALTSTVGERTGDMIQGYLRLRKVAKFTANMKQRNRRCLHSALLDGHGCRHEQQTTNGCLMQTLMGRTKPSTS